MSAPERVFRDFILASFSSAATGLAILVIWKAWDLPLIFFAASAALGFSAYRARANPEFARKVEQARQRSEADPLNRKLRWITFAMVATAVLAYATFSLLGYFR